MNDLPAKLKDISSEFRTLLDDLANDPFAQELLAIIPVIKTGVAMQNIIGAYEARQYVELMYGWIDAGPVAREKLLKKLGESRSAFFIRCLKQIRHHDDMIRSRWLALSLKGLAEERIGIEFWETILGAIQQLRLDCSDKLVDYYSNQHSVVETTRMHFAALGLVEFDTSMIGTIGGSGPSYECTELGRFFAGVIQEERFWMR